MTIKEIQDKLDQEQFDVKGYPAVFQNSDGTVTEIESVHLDEVGHQVRFVGFEAADTETLGD